jgi:RimJ/RimL family protein N-acetyltransferase
MVIGSSGSSLGEVLLRDLEHADLPLFFEHQRDPVANEMASFPPRERDAFMEHWAKILADDAVIKKTILFQGHVAGNIVGFDESGRRLVGYWLGRDMWGKGIATRALSEFISAVPGRPLYAHVAKHHLASIRVLEKCGFVLSGEDKAPARDGEIVEEFIYVLGVDPASHGRGETTDDGGTPTIRRRPKGNRRRPKGKTKR